MKCDGGARVHCFAKRTSRERQNKTPTASEKLALVSGRSPFSNQGSHLVIRLQMCAWALAACGKLPLPTLGPQCSDIQASHTQMCICVLCQWVLLVLLTSSSFPLWLGSQATHVSSILIYFWFSDVSTCCAVAYSEVILLSSAGSLLNLLCLLTASMKFSSPGSFLFLSAPAELFVTFWL